MIENSAGGDLEYYTNLYGFDDQDFTLIAAFESIVEESDDEWNTTKKLNGEVIYSGSDSLDLWDNVTDWLEHYCYDMEIPLRSTSEEIDTSLAESYMTDTLAWLDNPDAFKALSSLIKEYKSIGHVYYPELDGNIIHADIKSLGYGNTSRIMSVDVDITTNIVTEHDSNGYYGEYTYSLEEGRP